MNTKVEHYFILSFFMITLSVFSTSAFAGWNKTYSNPMHPTVPSYRLDWCHTWGTNCGKIAADKFCSIKKPGAYALGFKVDPNIGAQSATRTVASNQVCGESFCDGFKSIACVQGTYPQLINVQLPKVGGNRLDWCHTWGKNCGYQAARAYCLKYVGNKGEYDFVQALWKDTNIGAQTPTRTLGDNKVCDQAFCDGFSGFVCRRGQF